MHQQFNLLKPTGYVMQKQFNILKPNGHVMHQQFNLLKPTGYVMHQQFNTLKTKRRLFYLKTQFVPCSKHLVSVIKTNQFML